MQIAKYLQRECRGHFYILPDFIEMTKISCDIVHTAPGCEAGQLHLSHIDVKNAWRYTSTPPIRLHGVVFN